MDTLERQNKTYTTCAWGSLFLLLGVLMAIPGDQNSIFLLGTGIIFLGLNLWRRIEGIPLNLFSTLLGILAVGAGLYGIGQPLLRLPHFEIGFIPLALIVVGLYILIPGSRGPAAQVKSKPPTQP